MKHESMIEILNACPLCDSHQKKLFLEGEDYFLTREKFAIDECRTCGFHFTNPRPTLQSSGKYYHSVNYLSHGTGKRGIVPTLYGIARYFTLHSKYKIVKRYTTGNSILDIGCGTGEFLNFCQKKGLKCSGVEPTDKARNYAVLTYGLDIKADFLNDIESTSRFDCITLWHVLEHIHRLDETLLKLTMLLNPDGVLIVALPNNSSYDANYYGKYWAGYDLPRHLFHFTKSSLETLAVKHNFICLKILPQKLDAFYIAILSEKYKNGSTNYFRAFFRGILSNCQGRNPRFGHSSQIYLLKHKIS